MAKLTRFLATSLGLVKLYAFSRIFLPETLFLLPSVHTVLNVGWPVEVSVFLQVCSLTPFFKIKKGFCKDKIKVCVGYF